MILSKFRVLFRPATVLMVLAVVLYWQFFIKGYIPIPADTLVGAYYPWLDYKWGYEFGVPIKNAPISDIFSQIYVWKYLAVDMLKSGVWPLWNPYSLSGTPLLANYQSSPLFPFNILLFLGKSYGWGLFIFFQTLISLFGMYLFLGKLVKNSWAKVGGSIIFGLSGLMTTYTEFGIAVWAAAALPWIFYSVLSYLETKKVRYLVLLTFSFSSLYLAGHAQMAVYGSAIFLLYIFLFVIRKNYKESVPILLFWVLSVGIALAQLLPTYDLSKISIRGGEAYLKDTGFGLIPFYELIRLVAADFFGNPATVNHWDTQSYHEQSSFLGTVTVPLIIAMILTGLKNRKLLFWSGTFLVSIFLAVTNPITEFIYNLQIPLLTYSAASRILLITSFSAGILGAMALERLAEGAEFQRLLKRVTLVVSILAGGLLAGVKIYQNQFIQNPDTPGSAEMVQNLAITFKNTIIPVGLLFLLLFLLQVKRVKKHLVVLIVVILIFDLGRYFLKYNPFVPTTFLFPQTPVLEFLSKQQGYFRVARADHETLPPNSWIPYKISAVEGYDPMALANYAQYFNRVNGSSYQGRTSRFVELSKYPSNFLDSLNARYFLAVKRDEGGGIGGDTFNEKIKSSGYKPVFEDKNSVVFLNPNAAPRASWVGKVTIVNSNQELTKKINDPGFNPLAEGVIEDKLSITSLSTEGKISIESYQPNEVVLKTESQKDGFLVLADTFSKGWNLYVNQKPGKIYQVNGALRGILVPPGSNEFKLIYWPHSFEIGLKVTLLSVGVTILAMLYSLRKKIW